MWIVIMWFTVGMNRTKGWWKGGFALSAWRLEMHLNLLPSVPLFKAFSLWLEITPFTLWFLGLWTYTTGFLGSSSYRRQITGLLSLHNHASQDLTINLSQPIYHILVLFLWQTLTNIPQKGEDNKFFTRLQLNVKLSINVGQPREPRENGNPGTLKNFLPFLLSMPETGTFEWAAQHTQSSGCKGLNPYWLEVSEHNLCPLIGWPWTIQKQGRALGSQAKIEKKIKMSRKISSFMLWERQSLQLRSRQVNYLLKQKNQQPQKNKII